MKPLGLSRFLYEFWRVVLPEEIDSKFDRVLIENFWDVRVLDIDGDIWSITINYYGGRTYIYIRHPESDVRYANIIRIMINNVDNYIIEWSVGDSVSGYTEVWNIDRQKGVCEKEVYYP